MASWDGPMSCSMWCCSNKGLTLALLYVSLPNLWLWMHNSLIILRCTLFKWSSSDLPSSPSASALSPSLALVVDVACGYTNKASHVAGSPLIMHCSNLHHLDGWQGEPVRSQWLFCWSGRTVINLPWCIQIALCVIETIFCTCPLAMVHPTMIQPFL